MYACQLDQTTFLSVSEMSTPSAAGAEESVVDPPAPHAAATAAAPPMAPACKTLRRVRNGLISAGISCMFSSLFILLLPFVVVNLGRISCLS